MAKNEQPEPLLVYFALITLTQKGKRPVQQQSAYVVIRRDGAVIKEMPYIKDDPEGFYAKAEVIAAANRDAEAVGLELDERNIVVHYVTTTEAA